MRSVEKVVLESILVPDAVRIEHEDLAALRVTED
jgi:hypothetical protein